jgi:hypothetical protein
MNEIKFKEMTGLLYNYYNDFIINPDETKMVMVI